MSKFPFHWWRAWVKFRRFRSGLSGIVKSRSGRPVTSPRVTGPTDTEIRAEHDRRQLGENLTICVMCPKPLTGKRAHQKFCSGKCRTAYYRIKKALMEKGNG